MVTSGQSYRTARNRRLTTLCLLQLEVNWTNIHFLAGKILIILASKSIYNFTSKCMLLTLLCNFQCSRNDVFSHLTAMFVNMPFNKEVCILIKICLLKGYTAHHLCSAPSCYSLLICCHPFSTTYIFFPKIHQSLIPLCITSSLESTSCLISPALHKTPCWWHHTL